MILSDDDRSTLAVNFGAAPFLLHYSTNVNYHLNGYNNKGWVMGLGVGKVLIGSTGTDFGTLTFALARTL